MTTTIHSTMKVRALAVSPETDDVGIVYISWGQIDGDRQHSEETAEFDRAEFLAAVATELDVLVIPRTDLPEVVTNDPYNRGGVWATDQDGMRHGEAPPQLTVTSARRWRNTAMSALALAEYLDAHPPIDQAQVDALTELIRGIDGPATIGGKDLARSLLATGRVTITPDGGAS